MNISIVRVILRIFISVIDGFYWISNAVIELFEKEDSFRFDCLSLFYSIEFLYEDIFLVWETIAAARRTVSKRFVLFIALSMLKIYREIILDNRMDFTDIIRFFNGKFLSHSIFPSGISLLEMAERHDAREILRNARELVLQLQKLIDNK